MIQRIIYTHRKAKEMRWLILILCILLISQVGCVPTEQVINDQPENPEIASETPDDETIPVLEELVECAECTNRNSEERFLHVHNGIYIHDNWVFYNTSEGTRKCRPDLSGDTLVYSGGWITSLNQDGFATMKVYPDESRKPGDDEVHILDVHTGKTEKVNNLNTKGMIHRLLYKDYLIVEQEFVTEGHGAATRLDMYDRKGCFIKTIAPEIYPYSFAVVDDAVYYWLHFGDADRTMPSNTIMRMDIISGETEKFFRFDLMENPEFPWGIHFWPAVYFNGRTIIVFTGTNDVYTSIDEIGPQKISLPSEMDEIFTFISSDNDDIFFAFSYVDNEDRSIKLYDEYFRVHHGTGEPILLKRIENGSVGYMPFFSDGFMYYIDNGDLKMEQFY